MVLFAQGILKSGLLFVFNFNRKKIKVGKIFKVGRIFKVISLICRLK